MLYSPSLRLAPAYSCVGRDELSANGVKNKKGASRLRRNLSWNTLGIAIDTVVAFVVCPFLIKGLGLVEYGAWVTISALTATSDYWTLESKARLVDLQHFISLRETAGRFIESSRRQRYSWSVWDPSHFWEFFRFPSSYRQSSAPH